MFYNKVIDELINGLFRFISDMMCGRHITRRQINNSDIMQNGGVALLNFFHVVILLDRTTDKG
ncbi:hypothetical protein SDC9_105383 [bioreactor metagenome]|uniref:Uncharacterized protein n=1 Tax=bioreactor metagenome TaxID=1076179 RepID=A0A645AZD9_9ZZZZ